MSGLVRQAPRVWGEFKRGRERSVRADSSQLQNADDEPVLRSCCTNPTPVPRTVEIADSLEERVFSHHSQLESVAGPLIGRVFNFHFAVDFRVHSERRRENQV